MHECVFVSVVATALLYAPKWGCADSHWDPSLLVPHLDHRGCKGTSSPGVDPLFGVALGMSHILVTEAWMAKAGGDLKPRKGYWQRETGNDQKLDHFSYINIDQYVKCLTWLHSFYFFFHTCKTVMSTQIMDWKGHSDTWSQYAVNGSLLSFRRRPACLTGWAGVRCGSWGVGLRRKLWWWVAVCH